MNRFVLPFRACVPECLPCIFFLLSLIVELPPALSAKHAPDFSARADTIPVQVGFPAKFSDDLDFMRSPAPFFGEHTEEVLSGLGHSDAEIVMLKKEGVI